MSVIAAAMVLLDDRCRLPDRPVLEAARSPQCRAGPDHRIGQKPRACGSRTETAAGPVIAKRAIQRRRGKHVARPVDVRRGAAADHLQQTIRRNISSDRRTDETRHDVARDSRSIGPRRAPDARITQRASMSGSTKSWRTSVTRASASSPTDVSSPSSIGRWRTAAGSRRMKTSPSSALPRRNWTKRKAFSTRSSRTFRLPSSSRTPRPSNSLW